MNGLSFHKGAWHKRKGNWLIQLLLFVSYLFALSLSLIISYLCVKRCTWIQQPSLVISWVIVISVFLIVFLLQGLYQERMVAKRKNEVFLIIKGVLVGSILLSILIFISGGKLIFNRREGILFFFVSSLVLLALFRSILFFHVRRHLLKRGIGITRVLIVGTGQQAADLSKRLEQIDPFKYRLVGFVDKSKAGQANRDDGLEVAGKFEDIDKLAEKHLIDEIYIVGDSILPIEVLMLIEKCKNLVESIYVTAEMFQVLGEKINLGKLSGIELLKMG